MRYATIGVCVLLFAPQPYAQSPSPSSASPPTFEVASVKPSGNVNLRAIRHVPPAGQVLITNHSLFALVNYAFGLQNRFQLSGGPDWMSKEFFEIRATPPNGSTANQVPRMLQALLAERFNLKVRRETRTQPVYALTIVRADGRLGPELVRSRHDCAALFATGATVGSPDLPRHDDGSSACGTLLQTLPNLQGLSLTMKGVTIAEFIDRLQTFGGLDREVLDRTSLTGTFDARVDVGRSLPTDTPDAAPPSIYQALRERLGLKLEPTQALREVLVIESAERPTPD